MKALRISLGVLVVAPSLLFGQERCTHEPCALWVKRGFLTRDIVSGADAEHVAKITIVAPRVPLFAERSDSAAIHYASFRSAHNQSFALTTFGGIRGSVAFIVAASNPDEETLILGLAIPAAALGIAGIIRGIGAENRLARAIWWYNSTLPR